MQNVRNKLWLGLLLVAMTAYAQEETTAGSGHRYAWRSMVGYDFWGSGDMGSVAVWNEFGWLLADHFRLAADIRFSFPQSARAYGYSADSTGFLAEFSNVFDIGAVAYYEYLNDNRSGLEAGLGVFYRHVKTTVATGPNVSYLGDITVPPASMGVMRENNLGLKILFGYIGHIGRHLKWNVVANLYSDTNGNTGLGLNTGLSFRF